MAGSIDIYGGTNSISGANNFKVTHNPLNEISYTIGQFPAGLSADALAALASMLEDLTGLVFNQGIPAFLESLLAAIGGLAINLAEVVGAVINELITITGLDFANGPEAFLQSLVDSISHLLFNLESIVAAVINELIKITGLDFANGPEAFLASLVESIKHLILNLGEIITAIGNQIGISLANAEAFIEGLVTNLFNIVGIDLTGPFELAHQLWEFIEQLVHNAVGAILNFPGAVAGGLGELQEWVLETVFGIVPPDRLPNIPIGHLINSDVNLLTNPSFTDNPFVPEQAGDWVLDQAVSQDGEGGSARIDCSGGAAHNLLSVDLIPVNAGQRLDVSGWVKTQNLAGATVTFGVAQYKTPDGNDEPTYLVLASSSQGGTNNWKKLAGTYVTPPGVARVRVHIQISHGTAGTVWIDNLFCGKLGLLQIDWVDGLPAFISSVQSVLASLGAAVADAVSNVVKELEKITGVDLSNGPLAFAQSIFDAIWHLIQSAILGITVTAENVAESVTNGINSFGQALWDALTGRPRPPAAETPTSQDAADQLAALVATITAQSTTITQLQAAVNGPAGGLIGGDDFERTDLTGLGPLWNVASSGAGRFALLDGHQAVWEKNGFLPARVQVFRAASASDYQTKTAYQAITRVTGTNVLESVPLLTSATDEIYGRVSADGKSYIVVKITVDRVSLQYNLNDGGGDLELAWVNAPAPGAAVTYTLECGNSTKDFQYRVLRNGAVLINHDDNTARKTAPLFPNRRWGFGGAASGTLFGQVAPSSLHSVTVADLRSP